MASRGWRARNELHGRRGRRGRRRRRRALPEPCRSVLLGARCPNVPTTITIVQLASSKLHSYSCSLVCSLCLCLKRYRSLSRQGYALHGAEDFAAAPSTTSRLWTRNMPSTGRWSTTFNQLTSDEFTGCEH
ncbi:hypothetical protein L227DRAFT_97415 [Lentinus tigrinus ALCF2SS1-6]|uniref:Uncharacterized protein n=1 Tax=Lentinus tigrinus ALCF2SS1-6 TaxID=1328759 RepID=A0A5C2SFZ6_9APHY|nr:hypothetical protein L227DRAFT_97415 [Lentinus tigrinus ALCF2SS1-6]